MTTHAARCTTLLSMFLAAACYQGIDGGERSPAAADDDAPGGAEDPAGGDGEGGTAEPGDPNAPDPDAPFEVPGSEVEALPFHVRVQNLATVAGVKTDDPMFADMYAKRYQLGDHDYATGIAPNLRWTPEHMEAWVKALRPICSNVGFQSRYPDLATDPSKLVQAAFAREATADERLAFDEVAAGQVDGAGRHRMVCLAVLTSLEFVAR